MLSKTRRLLLRLLGLVVFVLLGVAHIIITARLNALKSQEGSYANIHNHRLTLHNLPSSGNTNGSKLLRQRPKKHVNRWENFSWVFEHLEKAEQAQKARQQAKLLEEAHNKNYSQSESTRKHSLRNRAKQSTKSYGNVTLDDPSLVKLREHGVHVPESEAHKIPSWSQITDILGKEPVIVGLETCEQFRASVPAKDRYVAVSGSFNTGTNLFPVLFRKSCQMERHGVVPQVPWGKHNLAEARLNNFRLDRTDYEPYRSEDVLPVVMVRHPISWMFSTCVHSYSVHWKHDNENCPHLINSTTGKQNPVSVGYGYKGPTGKKFQKYDSLIHVWRHWYHSYAKLNFNKPATPSFPRLIVRLEDIVYQPDKVLHAICACAGGTYRQDKVALPEESIKTIAERKRKIAGLEGSLTMGKETSGLLKSWIDHASTAFLWKRMTPRDQHLVKQVLLRDDEDRLMEQFQYKLEGK